jgi:hypothetical protein
MRQLGITAALGGYTLAPCCSPASAAEWSITPSYNATIDFDTNRQQRLERADSGAGFLSFDLKVQRAVEDLVFTLEPNYEFRRFTDRIYGNGDNRSVTAAMTWTGERDTVNFNSSYLNQSTLTTEAFATGILASDTFQRNATSSLSWTWSQIERYQLITQFSYSHVDYYGLFKALFPGYQFSSGSLGERYLIDERTSLTLGGFGDFLDSPIPGASSHEAGLQLELIHQFSEQISLDASVGESRRMLQGSSSLGTTASVTATRSADRHKLSLQYQRSLVPYGNGFLVEKQQFTGSLSHSFTEYLDGSLGYTYAHNNEATVLLRLDHRSYSDFDISLAWRPRETLAVTLRGDAIRSQLVDRANDEVREWRAALSVLWQPHPLARSW